MNRLPSLTAAEEPTKLASVTAAITSDFSPAWWPCSAVTVIVVVTIPAGHIRQSSSPASSARLRASACTRNTADVLHQHRDGSPDWRHGGLSAAQIQASAGVRAPGPVSAPAAARSPLDAAKAGPGRGHRDQPPQPPCRPAPPAPAPG